MIVLGSEEFDSSTTAFAPSASASALNALFRAHTVAFSHPRLAKPIVMPLPICSGVNVADVAADVLDAAESLCCRIPRRDRSSGPRLQPQRAVATRARFIFTWSSSCRTTAGEAGALVRW